MTVHCLQQEDTLEVGVHARPSMQDNDTVQHQAEYNTVTKTKYSVTRCSTSSLHIGTLCLTVHAYLVVHEQAVVQLKGVICRVADKIQ